MRRFLLAAVSILVTLSFAAPSGAIVNGVLDGDDHPNVGVIVAEWREAGVKELFCSGTLIGPAVFLTAGHCTGFLESVGVSDVWVTFDTETDDPIDEAVTTLIAGSYVTHPEFGFSGPGGISDPHDMAVVLLDDPAETHYPGIAPASLPTLNQFGKARELRGQRFTAVGYGVHLVMGGGPPAFPFDGDRWQAVSRFRAIENAWLHLSQNPSTGDGGTCFGDSGGPNFLGAGAGETDVIAAVTVTGDAMCRATNVVYRLDTRSARDFLDDFVPVP